MCGIFALLNQIEINKELIKNFQKGKKRGPENSTINIFLKSVVFGFHRLAINGQDEISNQPLNIANCVLICNGEIYNHTYLFSLINVSRKTKSDCEIIIHLYKKYGIYQTLQLLDGVLHRVIGS